MKHPIRSHEQRFATFALWIALPHFAPEVSEADRTSIAQLKAMLEECAPPISYRDIAGLIALRLSSEFTDKYTPNAAELGVFQGLALAIKAETACMRSGGFAVSSDELPPIASWQQVWDAAIRIYHRWREWFREAMEPTRQPRDERETKIRELARLHCMRTHPGGVEAELKAANRAKKLLDADLKRRGFGPCIEDPEGLLSELYTLGRGELGRSKILRIDAHGELQFDAKAMRDVLRLTRLAASKQVVCDPQGIEDLAGKELDPAEMASQRDSEEALAERLRHADELGAKIAECSDYSEAELASAIGISERGVRKRLEKIRHICRDLDPRRVRRGG